MIIRNFLLFLLLVCILFVLVRGLQRQFSSSRLIVEVGVWKCFWSRVGRISKVVFVRFQLRCGERGRDLFRWGKVWSGGMFLLFMYLDFFVNFRSVNIVCWYLVGFSFVYLRFFLVQFVFLVLEIINRFQLEVYVFVWVQRLVFFLGLFYVYLIVFFLFVELV